MKTQKGIEIHNYRTAIHEIFIIERKEKTTLKLFDSLQKIWDSSEYFKDYTEFELELFESDIWNQINKNTDYMGEVHFQNFTRCQLYTHNRPSIPRYYQDKDMRIKILAHYNFAM